MGRVFLFLFVFLALFAGSFTAARVLSTQKISPTKALPEKIAFRPSPFPLKNQSFVVVVIGRNNGAFVAQTLSSVFSQNYENYRLIYIDDASSDGSFDLAREIVYSSDHLAKTTLVQNEEQLGILANLCRAVETCRDEEIVVSLQGEDWLAHEWVLQRLNSYYADPNLWLTYGQYRDFPTYQLGVCHEVQEEKVRSQPFTASHLKTFYAALFKKIRPSDFVQGGKFLAAAADLATMIPMLEMAKDHTQFISEVLYIHNRKVAMREDREAQARCEKFIRALDPYSSLNALQVRTWGD